MNFLSRNSFLRLRKGKDEYPLPKFVFQTPETSWFPLPKFVFKTEIRSWDSGGLEMNFLSRNSFLRLRRARNEFPLPKFVFEIPETEISFLRLLAAQRASVCVSGGPRLPGKESNRLSGKTSEAKLWQQDSVPTRGFESHRVRLPRLPSPHFFLKFPLAKLTFSRLFKPWPCPSLLRKAKNEIPFPKFVFGAPESWKYYIRMGRGVVCK